MDFSRARTSLVFMVSFADLARYVVAQCRCGMTNLSGNLFSDIVDDVSCNATSNQVCCVNGTAVDLNTYRAVKAYNCTSECFEVFGLAPAPTLTIDSRPTSPQVSGLSQSALIAIVVGVIVVFLFVVCLLCICLRRRKRVKKKSNRAVTLKTDARIRDDLHTIITSSAPSVSTTQEDDANTSSFWSSKMIKNDEASDMSSSEQRKKTSATQSNIEYEDPDVPTPSLQTPETPIQHPTTPETISNHVKIASHPIEIAASPEWEDREIRLDEGSPPDATTSLNRYLQSQGFSTS